MVFSCVGSRRLCLADSVLAAKRMSLDLASEFLFKKAQIKTKIMSCFSNFHFLSITKMGLKQLNLITKKINRNGSTHVIFTLMRLKVFLNI